jgi:hypothetical protein
MQYHEISSAYPADWPQIMQNFYASSLMNIDPRTIETSPEFQVFRAGFDVELTPDISSFCAVRIHFTSSLQGTQYNNIIGNPFFLKTFICKFVPPTYHLR